MNTMDFVAVIKDEAARLGYSFEVVKNRGKGSHRMVHVGGRKSTVPFASGDIPLGTRRAILKQLRLDPALASRQTR